VAVPERNSARPRAYRAPAIALATIATLAVITLGIVAGKWQYGRYEARAEAVRAFQAASVLPPAELTELVAQGPGWAEDAQWRTVTASGVFDDGVTGLRGRSVEGTAALHYLAWLVTDEGPLLIDIGWLPRSADATITPPAGTVEISGVLRTQETDDGRRGDGATRIVAAQVPAPPADAGEPLPGYVMLREPCEPSGCLDTAAQPPPLPQLSLGPHLSYAYQWWLLALLAPCATVLLLRRDARLEREANSDSTTAAGRATTSRRARKLPTDEEIEDAL
jgi:cytochrome oxidase assembly protein ShyY1